jgi:hypothetical protein
VNCGVGANSFQQHPTQAIHPVGKQKLLGRPYHAWVDIGRESNEQNAKTILVFPGED